MLRLRCGILFSPACARFFTGAALVRAGNDVSFADAGEVLRIDRLVQLGAGAGHGAEWWVLDWKLTHAPGTLGAYRER